MKKLVFVTGGGRGIGQAIAIRLAADGYTVAICARSKQELDETKNKARGEIITNTLDVTDYEGVDRWLGDMLTDKSLTPWGLVTAAGTYGVIGSFIESDWKSWREGIEINLLGSAFVAKRFAELLVSRGLAGRIVLLSGGGATKPMPNFSNYSAAKSAIVRFGETLAIELLEKGITVNSIAPGAINTKLVEEVLKAGPEIAGRAMYNNVLELEKNGGADVERASSLVSYLFSDKGIDITGRLISAIWDPWETLHENKSVLENKEMFTLRRVTLG